MTTNTDKQEPPAETKPAVETTKVAEKKAAPQPTEAQAAYEKLVRVNTTGWDGKRIVAHRKKCTEALAAKRADSQ